MRELVIFGAQGLARMAQEAIEGLNPEVHIQCFLVSRETGNAKEIAGRPVRLLSEFASEESEIEKRQTEILIAAPESIQPEIEELLEIYGFSAHKRLNTERWAELVKLYHVRLGKFRPIASLPIGMGMPFVRIFAACSQQDTPLMRDRQFPAYILPIQAGAALCDRQIARLRDDTGENISEKNGNYCELTALYWIWKNRLFTDTGNYNAFQYFGLAHYRRFLRLDDDDWKRLAANDVDVVLPYPLPYEPDIQAHHRMYLQEADWQAALRALREVKPEYAKAFPRILQQRYFFNCNVILAKRKILAEYCAFLFPILERTEQLSIPRGEERSDRYLGYLAESLETLYFMENAKALNIVHTDCVEIA